MKKDKKEDGGVVTTFQNEKTGLIMTFEVDKDIELAVRNKAMEWKVTFDEAFKRLLDIALTATDFHRGRN